MAAHIARKRFGQHFLTAVDVIDRIVKAIAPKPGEAQPRSPPDGALPSSEYWRASSSNVFAPLAICWQIGRAHV